MTQENTIGNNQAQKINSVRSEIGVGETSAKKIAERARLHEEGESLQCACVRVCGDGLALRVALAARYVRNVFSVRVRVRERVIVCEKCQS
jgi:hypothetical protein